MRLTRGILPASIEVDLPPLDHPLGEGAGVTAVVLHSAGGMDGLGGVYADQPDPLAAVQHEGVAELQVSR